MFKQQQQEETRSNTHNNQSLASHQNRQRLCSEFASRKAIGLRHTINRPSTNHSDITHLESGNVNFGDA